MIGRLYSNISDDFKLARVLVGILFTAICVNFCLVTTPARAEDAVSVSAAYTVEISPAVAFGSFIEGNTFDVPILLNTRGENINTITLDILYDPDKLSIVNPSGGKSIVSLWFEPPTYDNTLGVASLGGIITNGITTEAGLITTITFKAKASGQAAIEIGPNSRVLMNDGLGTDAHIERVRGVYTLLPSPPGAVTVYSQTHPQHDNWYNNDRPVITWDQDPDVTRFAYVLDNKPHTVPETTQVTADTQQTFTDLADGVWYFHIRSEKNGVWGTASHFKIQIDTLAPAEFKPEITYLTANGQREAQVSFFTTDHHSGVDYYEVGALDLNQALTSTPAFVEADSPYRVQLRDGQRQKVTVRVLDKAGNVRDATVTVRAPQPWVNLLQSQTNLLLGALLAGMFLMAIIHYLIGHHILHKLIAFLKAVRQIDVNKRL